MQVTGDQSKTLYSERYQQTYHSKHGAVNESLQVFLSGSTVADRLAQQRPTRVLEIGFGLGLNFVLTADFALQHSSRLEYVAIEHLPISASLFAELDYRQWSQYDAPIKAVETVLSNVCLLSSTESGGSVNVGQKSVSDVSTKATFKKSYTVQLSDIVHLQLHIGDVVNKDLQSLLAAAPPFDAIYLDAFSPDVNPECWTQPFFRMLSYLLTPNGVIATYCVKGSVQRNLASAGFSVVKAPGPIGKREILSATLTTPHNS